MRVYGISVGLPKEILSVGPLTNTPFPVSSDTKVLPWDSAEGNIADETRWYHHWEPGGERWLSAGRKKNGFYVLRFVEEGIDFALTNDGKTVYYQSFADFEANTIRHLLLSHVLPMVMNLQGKEALHASSVWSPKGAIAFVGQSGSGKSTLAAYFIRQGNPLISDEVTAIFQRNGRIWTTSGPPEMGLYPKARKLLEPHVTHQDWNQKCRIDLSDPQYRRGTFPVSRIYFLNPSEKVTAPQITLLSPRESLMELLKAAYRLDLADGSMLKRQLFCFSQVAHSLKIKKLIYPASPPPFKELGSFLLSDMEDAS